MVKSILITRQEDNNASRDSKCVRWSELTIYEFPNELGDNPGVNSGCPITIGWKHQGKNVVDVNFYEYLRLSNPRRGRKDLILKAGERDSYLLSLGYSLDLLMETSEECRKIRDSRRANIKGNTWTKFAGVFEKTAKGVYGVTGKGMRMTSNVITTTTNAIVPRIKTAKSA